MPSWDFPPAGIDYSDHEMVGKAVRCGVRMAIAGLLESLMSQALIDQITQTASSMRRTCFGQALGNILSSFFGTQGGSAMLNQSLLNVSSGGLSRLSGIVAGCTLIISIVVLAPLIAEIPVAALVGLVLLIAMNTFVWSCVELIVRINWIDFSVVVLVTLVTLWHDLFVGVFIGIIVSGLGFAWTVATEVRVDSEPCGSQQRTFYLRGPLFFGSAMKYRKEINPTLVPEDVVVLDFTQSRILDISGIDAIDQTREYLIACGKRVILKGVPREAMEYLPPTTETMEVRESDEIPGVR